MGVLDGILGNVVGSMLGGGQTQQASSPLNAVLGSLAGGNTTQSGNLLSAAMSMVQQNGGLDGILNMFRGSGMAQQADSWVGTGPNASISADQLQQAVGAPALGGIASRLGLSVDQAGSAMAQILPELVNHLTPDGRVPDNHRDLISEGLSALRGKLV
jgi:uncharacterized protein YidB (DUF937 family)